MTYREALELVKSEFETRRMTDNCEVILTHRTLDGIHSFSVTLYTDGKSVVLSDIGETKEVFFEVEEETWKKHCVDHGFEFRHWSIVREFRSLEDVYAFIEFLNFIADTYDPLEEEYL